MNFTNRFRSSRNQQNNNSGGIVNVDLNGGQSAAGGIGSSSDTYNQSSVDQMITINRDQFNTIIQNGLDMAKQISEGNLSGAGAADRLDAVFRQLDTLSQTGPAPTIIDDSNIAGVTGTAPTIPEDTSNNQTSNSDISEVPVSPSYGGFPSDTNSMSVINDSNTGTSSNSIVVTDGTPSVTNTNNYTSIGAPGEPGGTSTSNTSDSFSSYDGFPATSIPIDSTNVTSYDGFPSTNSENSNPTNSNSDSQVFTSFNSAPGQPGNSSFSSSSSDSGVSSSSSSASASTPSVTNTNNYTSIGAPGEPGGTSTSNTSDSFSSYDGFPATSGSDTANSITVTHDTSSNAVLSTNTDTNTSYGAATNQEFNASYMGFPSQSNYDKAVDSQAIADSVHPENWRGTQESSNDATTITDNPTSYEGFPTSNNSGGQDFPQNSTYSPSQDAVDANSDHPEAWGNTADIPPNPMDNVMSGAEDNKSNSQDAAESNDHPENWH